MAVSESPGIFGGSELQPADTATTVRAQNGETLTTDGPFTESKEVLGGFFLLDAENLDDAIALAARIPAPRRADRTRPHSSRKTVCRSVPLRRAPRSAVPRPSTSPRRPRRRRSPSRRSGGRATACPRARARGRNRA